VDPAVEFVTAILLPIGAIYGLIASFRVARWAGERRDSHNITEPEPIERLAATLRRLRGELESLETRTGVPNKHVRVRALRGAYLDVLGTACQRLGVTPPHGASAQRFDQADVYRVESELRQRGVDVREPTTR
jgi:hypothetical protein